MHYAAAAVQYEPVFADKNLNILRLSDLVRQAAGAGARLAVCPEMGTTGYRFQSIAEIAPLLEPVPGGPTTAHFAGLSTELGIHLVFGLPELDPTTGKCYNTAVLVGPDGFVGKYRKVHLFEDDATWASEGDLGFPVFDSSLGKIAVLICMDLVFMESCREVALAGADVIAVPVNWSASPIMWWARALENGTYLVGANRWGEERGTTYAGKSAIISPQGHTLGSLRSGDGITCAEVDTDFARQCRSLALKRRPLNLYENAAKRGYLSTAARVNTRQLRVAAGQGRTGGEMAEQILRAAAESNEGGLPLDLIVFPVCYGAMGDEDARLLSIAANQTGCCVVWGSSNEQGERDVWLLRPGGQVDRHPSTDSAFARAQVFELPWGRIGLTLAEDLLEPEVVRALAFSGADVIAVPADWPEESPRWLWAVRWMENETPLVVANRAGGSRIWHNHRPRPEAGPGYDSLIAATVVVGGAKEGFNHLRPTSYTALMNLR